MARLRHHAQNFIELNTGVIIVGPEAVPLFKSYWSKLGLDQKGLAFIGVPDPEHEVLGFICPAPAAVAVGAHAGTRCWWISMECCAGVTMAAPCWISRMYQRCWSGAGDCQDEVWRDTSRINQKKRPGLTNVRTGSLLVSMWLYAMPVLGIGAVAMPAGLALLAFKGVVPVFVSVPRPWEFSCCCTLGTWAGNPRYASPRL